MELQHYVQMSHLAIRLGCYTVAISYLEQALQSPASYGHRPTIRRILTEAHKESKNSLA